jgi:hypothetical protein
MPLPLQALEVAGGVRGEINLSFEISAFLVAATVPAEISLDFAGLPIGRALPARPNGIQAKTVVRAGDFTPFFPRSESRLRAESQKAGLSVHFFRLLNPSYGIQKAGLLGEQEKVDKTAIQSLERALLRFRPFQPESQKFLLALRWPSIARQDTGEKNVFVKGTFLALLSL